MNYDTNPIHTLYDNETLKHLVLVIIEGNDATSGTTFLNLCNQIRQQAIRDRALADLQNTVYSSEVLAPEEQVRVDTNSLIKIKGIISRCSQFSRRTQSKTVRVGKTNETVHGNICGGMFDTP